MVGEQVTVPWVIGVVLIYNGVLTELMYAELWVSGADQCYE